MQSTAVHSGTLTPVVSLPHESVMVYSFLVMFFLAFPRILSSTSARALPSLSSMLPSPAALMIWNMPFSVPKMSCSSSSSFSAAASFTPGKSQKVCLKWSRNSSVEKGYILVSESSTNLSRKRLTAPSWTNLSTRISASFDCSSTRFNALVSLSISRCILALSASVHTRKNSWNLNTSLFPMASSRIILGRVKVRIFIRGSSA